MVQGQIPMDDLVSIAAAAAAKHGSSDVPPARKDSSHGANDSDGSVRITEPPPMVAALALEGVKLQVLGPELPGPLPIGTEEGDEAHPSRWRDPDALHIELGQISLNGRTSLADLSLRREDRQRRDARRDARRGKSHVPESLRDVEISKGHAKSIEEDRHMDDKATEGPDGHVPHAAYPLPGASGSKHRIRTIVDTFRESGADFLYEASAACAVAPLRIFLREGRHTSRGYMFGADHNLLNVGPITMLSDGLFAAHADRYASPYHSLTFAS